VLDGWTAKNRAALQERHLFCERHRFALGLAMTASAAIVWLTTDRLQAVEVSAGVKLAAILVLYMASIHAGRGRIAFVLPKEIAVGLLFASGATLPLWSRCTRFPWDACLPWVFFGLLRSLKCLSIKRWENYRQDEEKPRRVRRTSPPWRITESRLSTSTPSRAELRTSSCKTSAVSQTDGLCRAAPGALVTCKLQPIGQIAAWRMLTEAKGAIKVYCEFAALHGSQTAAAG
jgi:hypothetical protein